MKILKSLVLILLLACGSDNENSKVIDGVDFRQEMRDFVIEVSQYAKSKNSEFIIIPQNGIELVTQDGEPDGAVSTSYLNAVDGHGQEDLFYGYDLDDEASPASETAYLIDLLKVSQTIGNTILVTDYCSTLSYMDDSYSQNQSQNFVSFAADNRELSDIPTYPATPHNTNNRDISDLSEAKNFLYLINPETFADKQSFISAMASTDYDLIIMDLFFHDGLAFSSNEMEELRVKDNGGTRLVIAYMSIGEAEDYRYYWQPDWTGNQPEWIETENPDWEGNYKVRYWEESWQNIIYGNNDSYLQKILDAGFDGVYLDIIDAYEYFE